MTICSDMKVGVIRTALILFLLLCSNAFAQTVSEAQRRAKDCNGGNFLACAVLGFMYDNGEGVRQDDSRALQLFGKACDLKDEDGCKNYAILKNRGVR